MKPCNESEIVGLKSMQPSKDYYKGYDSAENNYIMKLEKIVERIKLELLGYPPSSGYYKAIIKCLQIIEKYKSESEVSE